MKTPFEYLQMSEGKTIKNIVDLSSERLAEYQINFTDGSKLIMTANASGYDIEAESIDIKLYE